MNSQEYYNFLGKLYDILIEEQIISYNEKPKDLKTKKERLEKYLEKIERVQNKAKDSDRYLEIIRNLYYDRYVIKEEDIPDFYFKNLEKQYLDEGYGYINLLEPKNNVDRELKKEHIKKVINDQKDSLNNWLNYFLSEDSSYLPMWAKVWAFQGMLHIGNLHESKDGYKKRSNTTVNPFVAMDSEILGRCVELIKETFNKDKITDEELKKLLSSGSFEKIYGKMLANKKQIKAETTEGIWIKYNQETEENIKEKEQNQIEPEYIKLYNSLQGYNTGWCTAGSRDTAKDQIIGGDFYVYYSKDKNGEYKIPRIAIRMNSNSIGEIRGIATGQNIESNMEKVLEEKLKEFPDAKDYYMKVNDMKYLTEIYNKFLRNEEITKKELRFIYEIDRKIKNFGYTDDPRISVIITGRNKRKDLAYIFDCKEDEIGFEKEDLNRELVYYDGRIELDNLKDGKNLKLPRIVKGYVLLNGLTSAEGLQLPKTIGGSLYLNGLTSAKSLKLPETIGEYLSLNGLTSVESLQLPQTIGRDLEINSLTSAKGLKLPETIGESLYLNGLTSAEGLQLPETIRGWLSLNGLTNAEGLQLPETIGGSLCLSGLTSAGGLQLPETIGGSLYLNGLTSAKGLKLPETIGEGLCLDGLTSAKGLQLPEIIRGWLSLDGLTSAEGLKLPQTIGKDLHLNNLLTLKGLKLPLSVAFIDYQSIAYTLEEMKKLQRQEENLPLIYNIMKRVKAKVKAKGFISNSLVVISTLVISVLSLVVALLIMKY